MVASVVTSAAACPDALARDRVGLPNSGSWSWPCWRACQAFTASVFAAAAPASAVDWLPLSFAPYANGSYAPCPTRQDPALQVHHLAVQPHLRLRMEEPAGQQRFLRGLPDRQWRIRRVGAHAMQNVVSPTWMTSYCPTADETLCPRQRKEYTVACLTEIAPGDCPEPAWYYCT